MSQAPNRRHILGHQLVRTSICTFVVGSGFRLLSSKEVYGSRVDSKRPLSLILVPVLLVQYIPQRGKRKKKYKLKSDKKCTISTHFKLLISFIFIFIFYSAQNARQSALYSVHYTSTLTTVVRSVSFGRQVYDKFAYKSRMK